MSEVQYEYQVLGRVKRHDSMTWGAWDRVSGKRLYASLAAAKIRATLAQNEYGSWWDVEVKMQRRPATDWEDL